MDIELKDIGPCRKSLRISVPAEDVASEFDGVAKSFQKQAAVPGFRTGKAPLPLVRQRFAERISEVVKENLLSRAYRAAIAREKLEVANVLDLQQESLQPGLPFVFTVTLDKAPEFSLPEYRGIPVAAAATEISEEDVDQAIQRLRAGLASFEPADGAMETGDLARIDFQGTLEGQPVSAVSPQASQLDQGEGVSCFASEEAFLPEIGAGLVGMVKDERRAIEVTFPEGFVDAALAGRKAVFEVTLKERRRRVLPEGDEALLERLKMESMEALRESVRADLQANAARTEQRRRKNDVARHLLDNIVCELPESVVEEETRQAVREIVQNRTAAGVPRESIESERDKIFEEAARGAQERVKLRYVLRRIAQTEKVRISDDEAQRYLRMIERAYGMDDVKRRDQDERQERLERARRDLEMQKTLGLLLEWARVEGQEPAQEPEGENT